MITSAIEGPADELHTSDWPLTDNGCFAVASFELDDSNALQASVKGLAVRLCRAFPSIRAVYLRGSALESVRQELIKDVDVLAVIDHVVPEQIREIKSIVSAFWLSTGSMPRCDLELISLRRLTEEPFSTVIQLIVAFRAKLLVGEPIWPDAPQVQPSMDLCHRIQASHCNFVYRIITKADAAPHKYEPELFVSWMQKKTLRLGGILAMGVSKRFSRHPLRCASLIGETYTELGEPAIEVAYQYLEGRSDQLAWRSVRLLFESLSDYAERMNK